MRPRARWIGLLLGCLGSVPAAAQRSADQARLMLSVGIGQSSGGGQLWSLPNQPFVPNSGGVDTLSVSRLFRRGLVVVFSGTYFPGDHLGFNGEAKLLGLGTQDECRIVYTGGDVQTADLCSTIQGEKRGAGAVALSGGLIYRFWSQAPVHPYLRANLGLVLAQESFIQTKGLVNLRDSANGPADLTLLEDLTPSSVHPYISAGAGITAVAGRGYQLRFEVRDNYSRIPAVAGPTPRQGLEPQVVRRGKHFLSFSVSFDVILERRRGRRY